MSGIIDTVGARSGIVGSDVYPAGHVLQVVNETQTSVTGGAGDGTYISKAITISSTSNDVLIIVSGAFRKAVNTGGVGGHNRGYICGGSYSATTSGLQVMFQQGYDALGGVTTGHENTVCYSVFDTSLSGLSLTYSFYVDCQSCTNTYQLQCTLMEIKA